MCYVRVILFILFFVVSWAEPATKNNNYLCVRTQGDQKIGKKLPNFFEK